MNAGQKPSPAVLLRCLIDDYEMALSARRAACNVLAVMAMTVYGRGRLAIFQSRWRLFTTANVQLFD